MNLPGAAPEWAGRVSSAELETGTVNGRAEIDFPVLIHAGRERRFTTALGSGGPKIRAVTHNGSLSIRNQ